jgi:uncharacterized membrane-anchored protein YhcB (DUF1043 family)
MKYHVAQLQLNMPTLPTLTFVVNTPVLTGLALLGGVGIWILKQILTRLLLRLEYNFKRIEESKEGVQNFRVEVLERFATKEELITAISSQEAKYDHVLRELQQVNSNLLRIASGGNNG